MDTRARPLFLFDGDCGVCQNGTDAMQARMRPPVDFRAYQSVAYSDLGVSDADILEGPVLVRADGTHAVGAAAIAEVLHLSRPPFRYAGAVMRTPGIRAALRRVGHVLYRNRGRMPGATGACAMPVSHTG